jgi:hypothetical protein
MRITESQLRWIIRETLLTEARWTPRVLADKGMKIFVQRKPGTVRIHCNPREDVSSMEFGTLYVDTEADPEGGGICDKAWEVVFADVSLGKGMGPLLYDIAMELSGKHGLMPDRREVSSEAWPVWNYYLSRRPDIEHRQLDNPQNVRTPTRKDNCWQESAEDDELSDGWESSPLSKAYRVKGGGTPTINELERLGLITFKDE